MASEQWKTGLVTVVSGSQVIIGTASCDWKNQIQAGNVFKIQRSSEATYTVASVHSASRLILNANYSGTNDSGLSYVICRSFTTSYNFWRPLSGDSDWAEILSQNTIDQIDEDIKSLDERIEGLEEDAFAQYAESINASITNLKTRMINANASLGEFQTNIVNANASISEIDSGLINANASITSLKSNMVNANASISSLETTVNNAIGPINASISELKTNMVNANASFSDLDTGLINANASISDLQTSIGIINASIEKIDITNINSLKTRVVNANASIGSLQTNVINSNASLGELQTNTVNANASLGNIQNDIVSANASIANFNEIFVPVEWGKSASFPPDDAEDIIQSYQTVVVRKFRGASFDQKLSFVVEAPPGIQSNTIQYRPQLIITTTPPTSQGIVFGLMGHSKAVGASLGSEVLASKGSLTGTLNPKYSQLQLNWSSAVTLASLEGGRLAYLEMTRKQSHSEDDYGYKVGMAGFDIRWI